MTPPPAGAATVDRPRTRARTAPARRKPARRISGPATRKTATVRRSAFAAAGGAATVALPLGRRVARAAAAAPDGRLVATLLRGRAWIGVLAFMLIGIVFMQVTLLQMNAGIGRAVEKSASLERANGELRAQVSKLSSGERIQEAAASFGMISPLAGQVTFGNSVVGRDAGAAARALRDGQFAPGTVPAPIETTDALPENLPATGMPAPSAAAGMGATEETAPAATAVPAAEAPTQAQAPAPTTSAPAPAQPQAAPVQPAPAEQPARQLAAQQPTQQPTPAGTVAGGATAPTP